MAARKTLSLAGHDPSNESSPKKISSRAARKAPVVSKATAKPRTPRKAKGATVLAAPPAKKQRTPNHEAVEAYEPLQFHRHRDAGKITRAERRSNSCYRLFCNVTQAKAALRKVARPTWV